MRDACRFWNRASAKCETLVACASADARRFWNRAGAQCETLVAFGIGKARNARLPSFLQTCRREMRDPRRFCIERPRSSEHSWFLGFSIRKHYSHTFEKKGSQTPLKKRNPSPLPNEPPDLTGQARTPQYQSPANDGIVMGNSVCWCALFLSMTTIGIYQINEA